MSFACQLWSEWERREFASSPPCQRAVARAWLQGQAQALTSAQAPPLQRAVQQAQRVQVRASVQAPPLLRAELKVEGVQAQAFARAPQVHSPASAQAQGAPLLQRQQEAERP